jgi:acyl-coenzyme A thioesterase PaaI-like protein
LRIVTAATYPPELHVIRDLRLETLKTAVDHAFVWAPVQPHACTDSGAVRLGALGAVVDSAGAVIAIAAAAPDWIATADLTYHRVAPVQAGPLVCAARLVRAGASTIIVAVDVHDGNGSESIETATLCGHGLMSFSRIPASASAIKIDPFANVGVRTTGALPDSRVDAPLFDKIGLRVLDAAGGIVEVDKHDYVRNSFGTINGGVICMISEAAAEQAARATIGLPYEAADLLVHYLSQTRTGPARTTARILRHDDRHAVCELTLVDAGNEDQLLALATVTLVVP